MRLQYNLSAGVTIHGSHERHIFTHDINNIIKIWLKVPTAKFLLYILKLWKKNMNCDL